MAYNHLNLVSSTVLQRRRREKTRKYLKIRNKTHPTNPTMNWTNIPQCYYHPCTLSQLSCHSNWPEDRVSVDKNLLVPNLHARISELSLSQRKQPWRPSSFAPWSGQSQSVCETILMKNFYAITTWSLWYYWYYYALRLPDFTFR